MGEGPFARACELIDEANDGDPLALAHGRRAAEWVAKLDAGADDAQLLAARAHHLRRAAVPRSSYPEGRPGYLRWRRDAKERHASDAVALLRAAGYDDEGFLGRVASLIRKEPGVPGATTHEDAACLVFLETQLDELAGRLGDDKSLDVLRKTARKMSPDGLAAAQSLPLSPAGRSLLQRALSA